MALTGEAVKQAGGLRPLHGYYRPLTLWAGESTERLMKAVAKKWKTCKNCKEATVYADPKKGHMPCINCHRQDYYKAADFHPHRVVEYDCLKGVRVATR